MKNLIIAFLFIGFLVACQPKETTPDTLPMKVAMAYGYDKFDEVNSIAYTWNVQVDSATVSTRDWKWNIKERTVDYATPDTSYTYSLDLPVDQLPEADKGFINDKYWLMMPIPIGLGFWVHYEEEANIPSPISGTDATKLTIVYNSADGYTPGDAYDLYLDENNMILEWTFRRGNGPRWKNFHLGKCTTIWSDKTSD